MFGEQTFAQLRTGLTPKHARKHETHPPRVNKKRHKRRRRKKKEKKRSVSVQTIVVLFVLV